MTTTKNLSDEFDTTDLEKEQNIDHINNLIALFWQPDKIAVPDEIEVIINEIKDEERQRLKQKTADAVKELKDFAMIYKKQHMRIGVDKFLEGLNEIFGEELTGGKAYRTTS